MSTDLRARYLQQRVLTATPAQRVVMLYDRLSLDLTRAAEATESAPDDPYAAGQHLDHAMQIVAELAGSLRPTEDGPTENLASLYGYLLRELSSVRAGSTGKLPGAHGIVDTLRDAWTEAAAAQASSATPVAAGAWVG